MDQNVSQQWEAHAEYLSDFFPRFFDHIDLESLPVRVALVAVAFNPLFWNLIARNEWNNRTLTRMIGNKYTACYVLGGTIVLFGIFRDYIFKRALASQPAMKDLQDPIFQYIGLALFLTGSTLALSGIYALGFTGTYLGDYFGILMDKRVTSFPFNVVSNPIYVGSALSYFGTSFWFGKPIGFVLSIEISIIYYFAVMLEGPFTAKIYSMRDEYRMSKTARENGQKEE